MNYPEKVVETAAGVSLRLLLGACGGILAWFAGLPMPFLIGALVVSAALAIWSQERNRPQRPFPQLLRQLFMAVIGVMIGQSFSPELVSLAGSLWVSLAAVAVFVTLSQFIGFVLFRSVGGLDRTTAFFASSPGGLVEAIALGEKAGGCVEVIAVQHFVRVILVVVVVPLLFWFWSGEVVGSAARETLSTDTFGLWDIVITFGLAVTGMIAGRALRLPAPTLIGPLVLSAVLHGAGLIQVASPDWLLGVAQLVVGVGLGAGFAGIELRQLAKAIWLGSLVITIYMALALFFALIVSRFSLVPTDALFISFAPGGVTEMSLIALSLNISPIIVAAHHVFRITATVVIISVMPRLLTSHDRP